MHTMRISLFLLFSLCGIRQVSSRKCYVCESSADEACFNNVNQGDFQYDCAKTITDYSKTIDSSSEHLQAFISKYSTDYQPVIVDNFDCVTITGIAGGILDEERIIRGCIPKSRNCNDFEAPLMLSGFLTESCERCDPNLCNSQPQIKVTRIVKISTESYTGASTIDAESRTKTTTVETKRLSSLAWVMKFDYQIGFCCTAVLLVSTFF